MAIDLGIVATVASSFLNKPIHRNTVVFGEVGLSGEVRGVSQTETRLKEAVKMGFFRAIVSKKSIKAMKTAPLSHKIGEIASELLQPIPNLRAIFKSECSSF